jgi:DNA repair protein RadC
VRASVDIADRPRERLFARGVDRLSDAELVALVIGAGLPGSPASRVAADLIAEAGGIEPLSRAGPGELLSVAGVGAARAARLAAAFELGRRGLAARDRGAAITSPEQVYQRLGPRMIGVSQEVAVVLALSAQNHVLAEIEIGRGEVTGVPVHPREVFRPLIRHGAAGGLLAHNHPSGDPTPSAEDIALTRRLYAAGELIGIPLLDHVVVASGGFTSIRELVSCEVEAGD